MQIQLDSPLDMHLHFREGDMLQLVAPLSARTFAGGVIMPNLVPPVDNIDRLEDYRTSILAAIKHEVFQPYMTLFFKQYTEAELVAAKDRIIGIKLYPAGVTTNSAAGVRNLREAEATLGLMEQLDIPLLVHGETNGFVLDREEEFMPIYEQLARKFRGLKIIMEHITTRRAVELLDSYENLFATITLHHLIITLDDVAGGLLNPHLFCKPIAKRPQDRDALLEVALSAHSKIMFGSDSAPHPRHIKESSGCAAGVFTAPIALQMLAELFEKHQALANLQRFVSGNARQIYGITPPPKRVILEKADYEVPQHYGNVVPFQAGQVLSWNIAEIAGVTPGP